MFYWTLHLDGAPAHNHNHNTAVTFGHEVYSFGNGGSNRKPIDVNVFNTVSLCWRRLTPETTGSGELHHDVPSRREGHTAVLIQDTVYVWGGETDSGYCNVVYGFDVDTHRWFKPHVSGTVPKARYYHTACVFGKDI